MAKNIGPYSSTWTLLIIINSISLLSSILHSAPFILRACWLKIFWWLLDTVLCGVCIILKDSLIWHKLVYW